MAGGFMRIRVVAASLLSIAPLAGPPQQSPRSILALVDATVIDGTGSRPTPYMTLVIEGDQIRDIFPTGKKALPPNATVRELPGHFVIPGLIDAHVHAGGGPVDSLAPGRPRLERALRGGITTVRNMVGNCNVLRIIGHAAALGQIDAPDVYYSAVLIGPASATDPRRAMLTQPGGMPPGPGCHKVVDGPFDPVQLVAAAKGTGATGIKLYADLSAEAVRQITAEAHRQGLLVWAHATVFPARPSDLVLGGVDGLSHAAYLIWEAVDGLPVYHERVRLAPFTRITPNDPAVERVLRLMAERGTILDATMWFFEKMASAPDTAPQDFRGSRQTFAAAARWSSGVVRRARELGVSVSAGTDDVGADEEGQLPNLHREMELLVREAGFTPLQAIASATSIAARTMGLERKIGTVSVGKQADLVVLRADPTTDIRNTREIAFVVKRGRVIDVGPGRSP